MPPQEAGPAEIADDKVNDDSIFKTYSVSEKNVNEIEKRFTYHAPQPNQLPRYEALRTEARILALMILRYTPPSREQALALTKLEEAVMHANSSIAREP